jgi:hypothetical protein
MSGILELNPLHLWYLLSETLRVIPRGDDVVFFSRHS